MSVPEGERLARLETIANELRDDMHERREEEKRTRGRLHELEKVSAGLLELQKQLHRQNEARLRSISLSIQWVGLGITLGMFAVALASFLVHH